MALASDYLVLLHIWLSHIRRRYRKYERERLRKISILLTQTIVDELHTLTVRYFPIPHTRGYHLSSGRHGSFSTLSATRSRARNVSSFSNSAARNQRDAVIAGRG